MRERAESRESAANAVLVERLAAATADGDVALALVELDQAQSLAASFGEAVASELVNLAAARIEAQLRAGDQLVWLPPGKLWVAFRLVPGTPSALARAAAIRRELTEPFVAGGEELHTTASIGIAFVPAEGADTQTVIREAELAVAEAQRRGGNNVQIRGRETKSARDGLGLEHDLQHALDARELALWYQAQIELATGHIVGVEALLRWHHPQRGLIPLAELLPAAERTGLILPIGQWVLRRACIQAATWHRRGRDEVRVAVNLSARELTDEALSEALRSALERAQLEPRFLEVEIAHAVARQAGAQLARLAELGVRIAVQDVGSSSHGLDDLAGVSIHTVKLDRALVQGLNADPERTRRVAELVAAAHARGLRVVAEGVESSADLEVLRTLGCDGVQGFLLSRPVPSDEVEALLFSPRP